MAGASPVLVLIDRSVSAAGLVALRRGDGARAGIHTGHLRAFASLREQKQATQFGPKRCAEGFHAKPLRRKEVAPGSARAPGRERHLRGFVWDYADRKEAGVLYTISVIHSNYELNYWRLK